ncbi:putative lipid II flippase FtsW [Thiotrichales bacterium 19S3-7]|nr:putative lipid II flippase FtsW [Thiotrichales bacterium 19S3-7]MCF6801793.1 putative lipid II flippase FtsW [Thiotrichales bacterium 19S3-11]
MNRLKKCIHYLKARKFKKVERVRAPINLNLTLFFSILILLAFGWVMVTSASLVEAQHDYHNAFYFSIRQGIYVILGLAAMAVALFVPTDNYEKLGGIWIIISLILLIAVLIPGIGHVVNGSRRWIPLGFTNIQVSEVVKLCGIMYFSSYIVRHGRYAREAFYGVVKPLALLAILAFFLLLEPDFGASVVLFTIIFGIMFMGGVKLRWFIILAVIGALLAIILVLKSPYRLERVTGFLHPWENQYGSGYQLTQALIAFGRGGWFGLGLGNSVQKLFYLPEAHTDFIVSIIAEEFGAFGVFALMGVYSIVIVIGIKIARAAISLNREFESYVSYGIVFWLAFQVLVNIGVNTGILPTKGLTLPLISYGGSSLLIMCYALGILLRIDFENKILLDQIKPTFKVQKRSF